MIIRNVAAFTAIFVAILQSSCAVQNDGKLEESEDVAVRSALLDMDNSRYDRALQILSKVYAKNPNNFYATYNIAVVHHSLGEFTTARAYYDRAMKILDEDSVLRNQAVKYKKIIESNKAVLSYEK
jgi:tetratricopeptide (TPR) repeat protein